jgi:hypothetical protein
MSALWHQDADDDGYGDPTTEIETGCPEAGWIADNGDCNDADDTVNPDGIEVCDGVDNNCSSLVDDGGDCPCPVETNDGHGYMLCDDPTDFKTASYACLDSGYYLVSLGSAGENNWVKDQAIAYELGGPWIGLRDGDANGIYEWENGEALVYENWMVGEPSSKSELCVEMGTNSQTPGSWNDTECVLERRYVCESQ